MGLVAIGLRNISAESPAKRALHHGARGWGSLS